MPAGVNSTVGSLGTRTSLGRRTQPLDTKKSRNASRSSSVFMLTDSFDGDGAQVGLERDGASSVGDGLGEVARASGRLLLADLADQLALLEPGGGGRRSFLDLGHDDARPS